MATESAHESMWISRTQCGCTIRHGNGSGAELHLCAWHSRWVTAAKRVVLSGAVQELEVKATFTAEPDAARKAGV